ncbi:MAG: phosphate ABC transporter permease subunit PstC [Pseudomonadota bacterium]
MFWLLFLALLLVFAASLYIGAQRSRQVAGPNTHVLHSRPSYHGGYLAIMATVPALGLLIIWSIAQGPIIDGMVVGQFSDEFEALSLPAREAFLRDARAIAFGGIVSFTDELKEAAAQIYQNLYRISTIAMTVLMALFVVVGFRRGYSSIEPKRRTRHFVERAVMIVLIACSVVAIFTTVGIVLSLIFESIRFFTMIPIHNFLFGLHWSPQSAFAGAGEVVDANPEVFGAIPLIAGTLFITFIAMLVAGPVGLFAAIYLSDYASNTVRAVAKPVLEVLAGVPTVVYGFFAALTVAPFIRNSGEGLGLDVSSESALAAGLVMGIMIIPFVSSLSDDVISAVPQSLRDGSLALGSTKSETIRRVVLPAALPGIVSAMILAISRAIGETMIVVMAAGLAANLTINPLEAVTTVTVQIVTLLVGDQEFDSAKTLAAFALGLLLFCVTLTLNFIALRVVQKYREQYD